MESPGKKHNAGARRARLPASLPPGDELSAPALAIFSLLAASTAWDFAGGRFPSLSSLTQPSPSARPAGSLVTRPLHTHKTHQAHLRPLVRSVRLRGVERSVYPRGLCGASLGLLATRAFLTSWFCGPCTTFPTDHRTTYKPLILGLSVACVRQNANVEFMFVCAHLGAFV